MENNPNMIDSLFVPQRCIIHSTGIANIVRENRRLFLHKGSWHKFKGYAYSQMHKMRIKSPDPDSKRYDMVKKFGYDVKFAYHVVRLLNEVEQILTEQDIDLQRNREQLKAIRRGEWKRDEIENYFNSKERELETAYTESKLRYGPDEPAIKQLLLNCLEEHYGSVDDAVKILSKHEMAVSDIKNTLEKYRL